MLNKNFQKVFTEETNSEKTTEEETNEKMEHVEVDKKELKKLMITLDGRKAMGLDKITRQVLKGCSTTLTEPLYDIIKCSINTGKVPIEWKRADIVPIYKIEISRNH